MLYILIPVGLIVVFIGYSLYLLVIKDFPRFKSVFYPGAVFVGLWIGIYYLLLY